MYIIMGVLTTLVYFVARFTARLVVSANVSVVIAQIVAITFAFITNKKYVFKSQTTTIGGFLKEMISFFMARGLSFLLDLAITEICINRLCGFFVRTFNRLYFGACRFTGETQRIYMGVSLPGNHTHNKLCTQQACSIQKEKRSQGSLTEVLTDGFGGDLLLRRRSPPIFPRHGKITM